MRFILATLHHGSRESKRQALESMGEARGLPPRASLHAGALSIGAHGCLQAADMAKACIERIQPCSAPEKEILILCLPAFRSSWKITACYQHGFRSPARPPRKNGPCHPPSRLWFRIPERRDEVISVSPVP